MNIGWLTLLLLLPFVGAIATMLVPKAKALLAKQVALGFSLVTLVLTAVITIGYQRNGPADIRRGPQLDQDRSVRTSRSASTGSGWCCWY